LKSDTDEEIKKMIEQTLKEMDMNDEIECERLNSVGGFGTT
jgi:hypothetical protein